MRICSYNVNGIRAAIKKGLLDWIKEVDFDIIALQEIKATKDDIPLSQIESLGYSTYCFSAQKKGYSGVAIFTKHKPLSVQYGNGYAQSDAEGRVIQLIFSDFVFINAYFPSGTSGDERQQYKYQWLSDMQTYLTILRKTHPHIVLVGDYNIAHQAIDIHDPIGNKNSSGFLPEEREWFSSFLNSQWVDTYRHLHPHVTGSYSWWSQRFPSVRLQNKGWRIDYICTTTNFVYPIQKAGILPDVKHSDHCPIWAQW